MLRAFFCLLAASALPAAEPWGAIADAFQPPAEWAEALGNYASPLKFRDGRPVTNADEWRQRREEILADWHDLMGAWPPVLAKPSVEVLATTRRETFTQHRIRLQTAARQTGEGYLLIPDGQGPFPAVFVPFYDPETSAGLSDKPHRDFARQLVRRGIVALCIGSPGGDARKPVLSPEARCQPLSYLAHVSANAWQALAQRPEVRADRIGIVGHSYGGKWAMFSACLWEKFDCGVWSDPGIVFDETRQSINYQEPWYLGFDPQVTRKPGLVTPDNPRTGAYRELIARGHDLVELQALMAPRPFLVSGGAEDPPKRWAALNHVRAVNRLLGHEERVAMTNRPEHSPDADSNAVICEFLESWLKRP